MLVVAISGWKGSGKDMIAEFLMANHGFERLAFADPLKDNVINNFKTIKVEDVYVQDKKEQPLLSMTVDPCDAYSKMISEFMVLEFRDENGNQTSEYSYDNNKFVGVFGREVRTLYWTPRALCILEGSTKRTVDPDYWVKLAVEKADAGGLYVISDLRYKNELTSLKDEVIDRWGKVVDIRINRHETSSSNDPSERDLDDYKFSHVINNSKEEGISKEEIFKEVEKILNLPIKEDEKY